MTDAGSIREGKSSRLRDPNPEARDDAPVLPVRIALLVELPA
jgi:hypothetical protein